MVRFHTVTRRSCPDMTGINGLKIGGVYNLTGQDNIMTLMVMSGLGFHIILMEKTVKEIIRHHTMTLYFNRNITADDSGGFHT